MENNYPIHANTWNRYCECNLRLKLYKILQFQNVHNFLKNLNNFNDSLLDDSYSIPTLKLILINSFKLILKLTKNLVLLNANFLCCAIEI